MSTDVEALSDLFKRHPNVDRQVYLRCVQTTISQLELDTSLALKVSELIQQQDVFSVEEKKELQASVDSRLAIFTQDPTKIRRAQQNYSQMHLWLTEPTWQGLMTGTFSVQSDVLFKHLYLLGLRLPSESSFAAMTGLIAYYQPGGAEKTGFQLHTMLETVKGSWKSFQKKMKQEKQPPVHLLMLPSSMDELPESLRLSAFAHHPCVGPKTTGNDLETFIGKIPLRKSNMAVARSSSFDQSNGTPAIADGNNGLVLQLVQWMTRQLMTGGAPAAQQQPNLEIQFRKKASWESSTTTSMTPPAALTNFASASSSNTGPGILTHSTVATGNPSQPSGAMPAGLANTDPGLLALEDGGQAEAPKNVKHEDVTKPDLSKPAEKPNDETTPMDMAKKLVGIMADKKKGNSGSLMKRPAGQKKQCMKKPVAKTSGKSSSSKSVGAKPKENKQGSKVKKELEKDRKNTMSRAWHKKRDEIFAKTGDDEKAKKLAAAASMAAGAAWDKANNKRK